MARLLDSVFGHKDIITRLLTGFTGPRPGQTFLFVGPNGVGKKKTALGLAQALLCERSPQACGQCPSCLRVAAGSHESLKLIAPTGPQIKIEESREVIEFLSLKSLTEKRIVVIDQASALNLQAANALLKVLEEPPQGTFFFLISSSSAAILSTVRSRSRTVNFKPLTTAELARGTPTAPEWVLRASQGSFEKIAQLMEGPEQDLRLESLSLLQLFMNDPEFLTENSWREAFRERARSQRIVAYWISLLRDALYFQEGFKKSVTSVDQADLLNALAKKPRAQLLDFLEKTLKIETEILQNRDLQLLIEEFWILGREA